MMTTTDTMLETITGPGSLDAMEMNMAAMYPQEMKIPAGPWYSSSALAMMTSRLSAVMLVFLEGLV